MDSLRRGDWPGRSKTRGAGTATDDNEARKHEEEQDRQAGVRQEGGAGQGGEGMTRDLRAEA